VRAMRRQRKGPEIRHQYSSTADSDATGAIETGVWSTRNTKWLKKAVT